MLALSIVRLQREAELAALRARALRWRGSAVGHGADDDGGQSTTSVHHVII